MADVSWCNEASSQWIATGTSVIPSWPIVSISGQSWQLVDAIQTLAEGLGLCFTFRDLHSAKHFGTVITGRDFLALHLGVSQNSGGSHMDELRKMTAGQAKAKQVLSFD